MFYWDETCERSHVQHRGRDSFTLYCDTSRIMKEWCWQRFRRQSYASFVLPLQLQRPGVLRKTCFWFEPAVGKNRDGKKTGCRSMLTLAEHRCCYLLYSTGTTYLINKERLRKQSSSDHVDDDDNDDHHKNN